MGYLKQIEAVGGSVTPLHTFGKYNLDGDMGWQRRSETVEISNVDYGYSPFGNNAAPLATKTFTWPERIFTNGNPDQAKDDFAAACGNGLPVWLIWTHDGGYERVVTAELSQLRWPNTSSATIYVDVEPTFILRESWHERFPARQQVVGAGNVIVVGATPPGTNTRLTDTSVPLSANSIALPTSFADATVAGPGGVPTLADTTCRFILYGPYGGAPVPDPNNPGFFTDGGFSIANTSVTIPDANGKPTFPQLTVRVQLSGPYSSPGQPDYVPPQVCIIDCGQKTIIASNIANGENRRVRYPYQPYWFIIAPNSINQLIVANAGVPGTPPYGGTIDLQWQRRFL
jgi:hypothetical protein